MDSTYSIFILFIFLLIAALVNIALKSRIPKLTGRPLMTRNELEFWKLLTTAALPLHVGPQVAMGALLKTANGLDKRERTSARNRFDRKIVDFVLFDSDGIVQLIVELDDSTHKADRDLSRDRMTESAGYKTLRLRRRDAANVEALKQLIAAKLAPPIAENQEKRGLQAPGSRAASGAW